MDLTKRIDGKALANEILTDLKTRIAALPVQPALAVIQIGNNASSNSYIKQKKKIGESIGIRVLYFHFPAAVSYQKLAEKIQELNVDPMVHGLIVQQPLPAHLSTNSFSKSVNVKKDVDGLCDKSSFIPPVSQAVLYIFKHIYQTDSPRSVLRNKKIVLIGRGDTAGKPIGKTLSDLNIPVIQVNSTTRNKEEFYGEAHIIISCVGKRGIVKGNQLKDGVILIGVGIERTDEKLAGDYDEADIADKASYYTPTPGGTGPLTVAFLMKNVVEASSPR